MGRGVKRTRASDVQDGTTSTDSSGEGGTGGAAAHTHTPQHTNNAPLSQPSISPKSSSSASSPASSSPKRRKVASKSGSVSVGNASQSAATNASEEVNGMVDVDVGAGGGSSVGATTGGVASTCATASMLSAMSPESALRRSPRLNRADLKTPIRKSAKKLKNVKFAGKADVTMFFFGSPPIHQSQPRAKFRSPAPSARKTPLKRFLVSPSPVRTRSSARRVASELADESKEGSSNLATTSTAGLRHTIGSPPPAKRARHSFPSPSVPPPPAARGRPSSSSSSSSSDAPPPPPPPPVPLIAANGDVVAMDESADSPPPPPRSPPPSALSSNPAHQVPPSVVVGSAAQDISINLETPSYRHSGARRRSPRNRSRSLSPHSPRSPTIVSALLSSGRSRSPSLRRASISSTGSSSSFGLSTHVGDDALMSRRGSTGSGNNNGNGRRGGKKSRRQTRQVLSAIDIAAESVHRQFDFQDVEDAREHLKRELQTVRKNSNLQLEKRGVRIFSLDELERFVADTKNEVGVRTLIDRNEMNKLTALSRPQLRKRLCEFYTEDSIQPLTKKYMMKLLKDKYEEDMEETLKLRDNYIFRELNCRDLSLDGSREDRIQRLRDVMKIEVETFDREECELKREMDEAAAFKTLEEIQKQIGLIRKDILKEQLKVLGLNFHERTGTPPYEVAQIYMFRLELYLAVIEKAQLRSADLNPHNLTTEELEKEMKKRRLHIPDSIGERPDTEEWHDRVSRLNLALIEDKKKGPMKYDWGSAWFDRDDLTALTREQIISELESADALTPLANAMTEDQLRERLAESLIERSNKAVEDTLRTELKPFGKDKIRGDKGRLFRCLERVYWEHLANSGLGSPRAANAPVPWTPSPRKRNKDDVDGRDENFSFFDWVTSSLLRTFAEIISSE